MRRKMRFFLLPILMEHRWNKIDRGKPKYLGEGGDYPSATLSTTNPTWTDLGLNLGLHGKLPGSYRNLIYVSSSP
jgi:hypothetical protein